MSSAKPPSPASPAALVRLASPEDLDRIVAMWDAFMADQNRYLRTVRRTRANREATREHYARLLPNRQVYVLEAEGRVLGFSSVVVNLPRLDFFYASASISDVYLEPEARGRGWGRLLVDATVDALAERGIHAIQITVAAGNDAARALYRSLGFEPMNETLLLPLDPDFVRFGPLHPEE